jgi:hypothetical protein
MRWTPDQDAFRDCLNSLCWVGFLIGNKIDLDLVAVVPVQELDVGIFYIVFFLRLFDTL